VTQKDQDDDPNIFWGQLSRQRLEIQIFKSSQVAFNEWVWQSHKLTIKIHMHKCPNILLQRSTYCIWLLRDQMVTWPMTSRDPERSRLWHLVTLKIKIRSPHVFGINSF